MSWMAVVGCVTRYDAGVRELQTGLWHWEASHPEWTPANTEGWGPEVSSYAIDDGERLLLITG
jgi:hypothetical protein